MGESCLGQADVAAATDPGDGNCLMDGALDAGPGRVALFPLVSCLLGSGVLDRVVNVFGAQHQLPTGAGRTCRRTVGTSSPAERPVSTPSPPAMSLREPEPVGQVPHEVLLVRHNSPDPFSGAPVVRRRRCPSCGVSKLGLAVWPCARRKLRPCRSRRMTILADDSAEKIIVDLW